MIRFTHCESFSSAETKEVDWDAFARLLTRSVEFPSKEASIKRGAFIGGVREDESRGREANVRWRTLATIDYDTLALGIDDVEFALQLSLDCTFLAYSTFRHTPDAPRVRLCVPLERPVGEAEYRVIVDDIVRTVGLGAPDKCSYVMNQLMFLPSHRPGVEPWSLRNDGAAWPVGEVVEGVHIEHTPDADADDAEDDGDDLMRLVAARPLDITEGEVDAALETYEAEGLDYDAWLRVGMALYHQFQGGDEGWGRWLSWSEKSAKHDPRQMRTKWRSFGSGSRERPVTFASVIKMAGGLRQAVEIRPGGQAFEALQAQAREITDFESYTALRNKVRGLNEVLLHIDSRAMLASVIHTMFGKNAGLSLSEVKRALKPEKLGGKGPGFLRNDFDTPEWAKNYVYCAGENTFELLSTRHSLKPDAFRINHAGMPEVIGSELDAVTLVMRNNLIRRVDAKMYWPGFGPIFTDANTGLTHLNTYEQSGAEPCEELDEDGKAVVDRFLRHLDMTVSVERERRIILDFMVFVYQNPGSRVQWALLLKGIEGNGKSYFFKVMQVLLGKQASVVSTTAIDSAFTGWAEGAILACVEEIRISGVNKYAILDKMKPIISNDTIPVIRKGKDERYIPNFTSYMMMTNHADAIPIGDNDRRYCVIFTRQTRKEDLFNELGGREGVAAYFEVLYGDAARRPDALARFFTDYKISADFSPAGRAPETQGLSDMRNMHVSEDRENVEAALADYVCNIVNENIVDVTYLNQKATMDGKDMPQTSKMAHILSDMGYVQIEGRKVKINRAEGNHTVWYRRGALVPPNGEMTSEVAKKRVREFFNRDKDLSDAPF